MCRSLCPCTSRHQAYRFLSEDITACLTGHLSCPYTVSSPALIPIRMYLVHGVSVQVLKCSSKCLQLYHTCSLTSKIFLSFVVLFPWQAVHRSESEACKHSESMHSCEVLHTNTAHQPNIATKACTNRQASILLEYKHHMSCKATQQHATCPSPAPLTCNHFSLPTAEGTGPLHLLHHPWSNSVNYHLWGAHTHTHVNTCTHTHTHKHTHAHT